MGWRQTTIRFPDRASIFTVSCRGSQGREYQLARRIEETPHLLETFLRALVLAARPESLPQTEGGVEIERTPLVPQPETVEA